jgi:hypothetical protein
MLFLMIEEIYCYIWYCHVENCSVFYQLQMDLKALNTAMQNIRYTTQILFLDSKSQE